MTNESEDAIRQKISKVFSLYPRISRAMLHVGIGSSLPTAVWDPILRQMIDEGIVKEEVIAVAGSRGSQVLSLCEPKPTFKTT
jgi:hypothetical protein